MTAVHTEKSDAAPAGTAGSPPGTSATGSDAGVQKVYTHRQILVIMSGLMLGMLLAALDQTIVSTALTTISTDFHRPDLYTWVVTSYLLTSTASTPLYGKISDLYGRKRIFQFAIVVFLLGSVLSGLSQSMYQLIAFRAVQGLGAGGLITLALAIVGDIIPPRERGRYQGYFGAVFGAASVLGPLIGGFLVDTASWRWVFYVNVPIGLFALFVINRVLHLDHVKRHAKIDWTGAALLVGGVSLFLIAVQNVGNEARIDGASWAFGVVGLALVASFIAFEFRASEPLLPMRLFRNDVFRVSAILSLVTGAVMFGAILFLPQYMQRVRDVSPTLSGLRLLPLLGGLLLTSIGSGQLISRNGGYKKFVVSGTGLLVVGTVLLTRIHLTSSFWTISGIIFVVGFALGLFMQTTVLATQNSVEMKDIGVATSSVTFFRTLGGAIGSSVLGAVLIAQEKAHIAEGPKPAFVSGMDRAYLWAIPIAAIAFVVSLFLREVALRSAPTAPAGDAVTSEGVESEAVPAGAVQSGAMQSGAVQSGAAPAGAGAVRSEAGQPGAAASGAVSAATAD